MSCPTASKAAVSPRLPERGVGVCLSVCPWVSASLFVAPTKVGAHLMDPQVWSVGG